MFCSCGIPQLYWIDHTPRIVFFVLRRLIDGILCPVLALSVRESPLFISPASDAGIATYCPLFLPIPTYFVLKM